MAVQLEVECPVCKRVVKLFLNETIPQHRDAKAHRRCKGSDQGYRELVLKMVNWSVQKPVTETTVV